VGTRNATNDSKPKASALAARGKEGFEQACYDISRHSASIVAHNQIQVIIHPA